MAKFQVLLGSDWVDFSIDANRTLEDALNAGRLGVELIEKGRRYAVDFRCMTQKNVITGRERQVRVTFRDERRAKSLAETRAREMQEEEHRARAAAEQARKQREQAARAAAQAQARAELAERQAKEAEARARQENEARAAAVAREAAERARQEAEAAAKAEEDERRQQELEEARARAAATQGDKLKLGAALDEEGCTMWRQGKLEDARQRFIGAAALLKWVQKWDERAKNPKIDGLLTQRLAEIAKRSQQLDEELLLPPLGSVSTGPTGGIPSSSCAMEEPLPTPEVITTPERVGAKVRFVSASGVVA